MTEVVFVPDVGFRAAGGVRLREPVTVEFEGRRLHVDRLISTDDGTELRFEYTGSDLQWRDAMQHVRAELRDENGRVYKTGPWWSSGMGIKGGIRRDVAYEQVATGVRRVELMIADGARQLIASIDLVPVGADDAARRHVLDASDTKNGISVRARGAAFTSDRVAIDLQATAGGNVRFVRGIGALFGVRRGTTKLRLRDSSGREYEELDSRVIPPPGQDASARGDIAQFAVPADAESFELIVPTVIVEESDGDLVISLPVDAPRESRFGPYPIRVQRSEIVDAPPEASRSPFNPTAALRGVRVYVDFGEWNDDRRVLSPGLVLGDGTDRGYRWFPASPDEGGPPNAKQVTYIEAPSEDPSSVRELTLRYPVVQIRGPWSLRFARPG